MIKQSDVSTEATQIYLWIRQKISMIQVSDFIEIEHTKTVGLLRIHFEVIGDISLFLLLFFQTGGGCLPVSSFAC